MSGIRIQPLSDDHDRSAFLCGQPLLDMFLRTQAGQHARKDMSRTYVAVRNGQPQVAGFYTLAAGAVDYDHFPTERSKKLPRFAIPSILLARLAVDQTAKGQGLGTLLLLEAFRQVVGLSEVAGVHILHVHALDDTAAGFYRHHRFEPLPAQPLHLFLPLPTIRTLIAGLAPPDGGKPS